MSDRSADLEGLAARAASGDEAALNELLAAVEPDIAARCRRILPHPHDAEEATQDALLAVARRISSFEGRSAFSTWLYRVSSNSSVDTYRRLKRRWVEQQQSDQLPEFEADARTSVIAGTRIDLLDALDQLDARFAEPVVLRDVQGLDYAAVAEALDLPVGTVKSRIHEGRRQLRYLLRDG